MAGVAKSAPSPEPEVLEKHRKYKNAYGECETFWGFGIEEETYFQFDKPIYVATPILRIARKPERYSVSYYNSYKPETLALMDQMFPDASGCVPLPLFFNGHSFQKTDRKGFHMTTYEKVPKPNPKFSGKTIFQELQQFNPMLFMANHERHFTFDGDTIEFITQDFYKTTVEKTIEELVRHKQEFLDSVNECFETRRIFPHRGKLMYPPKNPGFAVFSTNPSNIAIFNNGTYHINITLPSELASKSPSGMPCLKKPLLFREQHRACIRLYQWLEPILIAIYGTPDPFPNGSRASQRCAMSRYIGIGTYDTDAMPRGKILTMPIEKIRGSDKPFWWYKVYHSHSAYNTLKEIGMDVNYMKHFLHGIELRIFDWFPESRLQELCELLVYVAEVSIVAKVIPEPVMSERWNTMVVRILRDGQEMRFTTKDLGILESLFRVPLPTAEPCVKDVYSALFYGLKKKYGNGSLAQLFLTPAPPRMCC
jgi:hypothetical protein